MAAATQRASSSVVSSCSRQSSVSPVVRTAAVSRRQSHVLRAAEVRVWSSWLLDHRHTWGSIVLLGHPYRQLNVTFISSTCFATSLLAELGSSKQQQQCGTSSSSWSLQLSTRTAPCLAGLTCIMYVSCVTRHASYPCKSSSSLTASSPANMQHSALQPLHILSCCRRPLPRRRQRQ